MGRIKRIISDVAGAGKNVYKSLRAKDPYDAARYNEDVGSNVRDIGRAVMGKPKVGTPYPNYIQDDLQFKDAFSGDAKRMAKGMSTPDYKSYPGFKKGGKVKKTGLAKVHKGERVLKVSDAKKFEKMKRKVFNIKGYGKGK